MGQYRGTSAISIRLRSDPGQMGESPTRRLALQQCESSFHIY
jgi:hypothetical protein